MTETTSDEDFADYTDAHQRKPPPEPAKVQESRTPDVSECPETEPPD